MKWVARYFMEMMYGMIWLCFQCLRVFREEGSNLEFLGGSDRVMLVYGDRIVFQYDLDAEKWKELLEPAEGTLAGDWVVAFPNDIYGEWLRDVPAGCVGVMELGGAAPLVGYVHSGSVDAFCASHNRQVRLTRDALLSKFETTESTENTERRRL